LCEQVIHAVVTLRANPRLTRITCSGIVDADGYDENEKDFLRSKGIEILPVSEIENIFLLPSVAEAIARNESFQGEELEEKLKQVYQELFDQVSTPANQESVIVRYCLRKIDRVIKKIDLSGERSIEGLKNKYADRISLINIDSIADVAMESISKAISTKNVEELLKWYDNKGVISIACKLKGMSKQNFEQWLIRTLRNNSCPPIQDRS
jgi:hypothetical protein